MPQTQAVKDIPPLCDLSGCFNLAMEHMAHDCKGHPVKYCSEAHKLAVLTTRLKLYNVIDVTPKA